MQGSALIEIFCSYAYEDEKLFKQLETHLQQLKREGVISRWHNRSLAPGTDWAHEIDAHLETSSLVLLLVSPNFLASDYCDEIEMQRILQRQKAGEEYIIPIIVRPCDWGHTSFAYFQALPRQAEAITTWSNQDMAWRDVTANIRQVIEHIFSPSMIVSHTMPSPIENIPYPQNPFFTGRDEILVSIQAQLQTHRTAAVSQAQAISDLGGIGKTQVAIEYAYQHRQDYKAVLWARAESTETLVASYVAIAGLLKLPQKDVPDQNSVVKAVKAWLERESQWLLILDNADDLAVVRDFIPIAIGGHLLLTTRAQDMEPLAKCIEIGTFSPEQGELFLLRRAALLSSDAALEQISFDDRRLARRLSQLLDGSPLALDQAGAYLEATRCGLLHYIHLYEQHQGALSKVQRGQMSDDYPVSVATTCSISLARLEEISPVAADLLRLCAFLDPDAIQLDIIRGLDDPKASPEQVAEDAHLLNQAIEALCAYALMERLRAPRTLSLHRSVQAVVRDALPVEERRQWMQRAVLAVSTTFPNVEFTQWAVCEQWLSHALLCAVWIEEERMTFPMVARLLNKMGYYLNVRARYAEAESLYARVLAMSE